MPRERDPYPTRWSYTGRMYGASYRPAGTTDLTRANAILKELLEGVFQKFDLGEVRLRVDNQHRFKVNSTRLLCFGWYEPGPTPEIIIRDFCLNPEFPDYVLGGTIYMCLLDRLWHTANASEPWPFHGDPWYMERMRELPQLEDFLAFRKGFHSWANVWLKPMIEGPPAYRAGNDQH